MATDLSYPTSLPQFTADHIRLLVNTAMDIHLDVPPVQRQPFVDNLLALLGDSYQLVRANAQQRLAVHQQILANPGTVLQPHAQAALVQSQIPTQEIVPPEAIRIFSYFQDGNQDLRKVMISGRGKTSYGLRLGKVVAMVGRETGTDTNLLYAMIAQAVQEVLFNAAHDWPSKWFAKYRSKDVKNVYALAPYPWTDEVMLHLWPETPWPIGKAVVDGYWACKPRHRPEFELHVTHAVTSVLDDHVAKHIKAADLPLRMRKAGYGD